MSFEVLSQKVQQHAKLLAEEENSQKEIELFNFEKESELRFEDFKKKHTLLSNKEKLNLEVSLLGSAKSKSKSQILEAKQSIMENINLDVITHFNSLSKEEKIVFYSHLLKRGSELIKVDHIFCSNVDKKILESMGLKNITILADSKIDFGIICECTKSKQRVDLRVNILLDSTLNEKEDEIISSLGGL
jgi:hypothetical protein